MIAVAIQCGDAWKNGAKWHELALKAVTQAALQTPHGDLVDEAAIVEISVKLTDNDEVQALNAAYRDKDRPTNVLAFPMVQTDMLAALTNSDDGEILLGDIVLAHGVCTEDAETRGISIVNHATHLIVHGMLHLLGYDHETDEALAEAMEAMERSALAALGIADPYRPIVTMDEV